MRCSFIQLEKYLEERFVHFVERTMNKTTFIELSYHIIASNDKTHTHVGNILITYIIDKVMCYKEEIKKHPDVESGWGGRGCVHERSFQQSI